MLSRSNWLILALAVAGATLGGYLQHRSQVTTITDSPMVGHPVPDIRLPDLDGKLHALGEYTGHRVLLNFWASWCVPCLDEMPELALAQEKFGGQAPIVVGIAMDEPDPVRAFLAAHPVNYPILLGQLTPPTTTWQLGNTREVLPYSVLIGDDGRILATHAGALSERQLKSWLDPASD
ncbi:MAG TPA: TlpA disulfide reductase family protein [Rhodanobacter sp.]